MVGVPGRSKGCNTCRRRKKGCDLQRPACGQCLKAGLDCAGYERKRVFVHVTNPGGTAQNTALVPAAAAASSSSSSSIIHSPPLARVAYEERILGLYWEAYMPDAPLRRPGSPIARFSHADWALTVQDLYRTDAALRQSLLAISLGTIGRRDKQQWMIDDGLRFYCQALSETNTALRHPVRWKSDALMVASRMLGLYELLSGADDRERKGISLARSWEGHTMGETALMVQRTPESHVDGHALQLFRSGRLHLAISHIKQGKRCILSDPVWKTVPWKNRPKSPRDILIDTVVDTPGLLEDLDRVQKCTPGDKKERLRARLVDECWRIDGELIWWLDNLAPLEELEDLRARGEMDSPTACDVAVASSMSLFWTTCILAYSTLRLALGPNPGVELPGRTDPRIYCGKVADIVHIFFHRVAGTFGISAAAFPIGMALVYLNSTDEGFRSKDKQKLASFCGQRPGDGIGIGKFLASMQDDGIVPSGAMQAPSPR